MKKSYRRFRIDAGQFTTRPKGRPKRGFVWRAVIHAARHYHGTAVELWPAADLGGFTSLSPAKMQALLDYFERDPM